MVRRLQIYDTRERLIARAADLATAPLRWLRPSDRGVPSAPVRRVLLLRLERIGDLLMVLDAVHDARLAWPDAEIDLAVGSWNVPLAELIADVNGVLPADAPWLARDGTRTPWSALVRRARAWRRRKYDLVVNFEPDIRSNVVAWLTDAPRRFGYWTGGGGAFLTDEAAYDPVAHVALNARRLVARAAGGPEPAALRPPDPWPRLVPPPDAVDRARTALGSNRGPLIGLHVAGGRPSKQWHVDRFAAAARRLAHDQAATVVLTGGPADQPLVDLARRALHDVPFVDASGGLDLPALAALVGELDLLITSDTGPMHLAAAMGTPVVALFGPADPRRYGPLDPRARVVRVDLWCSPCGRVRLPPERCRGHVPDCMDGISVDAVVGAATDLLAAVRARREGGS
jgi:ADP-heptose:LPS heptosyltransferase